MKLYNAVATTKISNDLTLKVSWPIIFFGAALGILFAWGVMSGDSQGRVNLLYVLAIYFFFPVISLFISSLSMVKGTGFNLAKISAKIPFWSNKQLMLFRKYHQIGIDKYWFFFQSHLAALAYSLSSLLVFVLLLLSTDIHFVWRSTVLVASDLLPLLEASAFPWFFWQEAQPSLELLQATQDSRLSGKSVSSHLATYWWQYVLAIQIFYCFILRGILLIVTGLYYQLKTKKDMTFILEKSIKQKIAKQEHFNDFSPVIHELPHQILINNWANFDLKILSSFENLNCTSDNIINSGPLATTSEKNIAARWQGLQVILVKSWEPPLGELLDFLENGQGYIWPIDLKNNQLVSVTELHLQEWQRFIFPLQTWQVYLPEEFLPSNLSTNFLSENNKSIIS